MRKTSWIWLAGTIAWLVDALVDLRYHAVQQAELALLLTMLFLVAWLYFRQSPR